ncbi:recombinase family protein [Streptomyces sp. NPDC002491]
MAAGHPAPGADRPGPAERGHPHRLRPLLDARAGTRLPSRRARGARHPDNKIFSEKISTRIRVRPKFEEALRTTREVKAHAPHCRVIFTVYEMKRVGRDAAELTALADHLTAHGLILEMLAGPLPGIYDPTGTRKLLFAFFAAMAETEREDIRESTHEGLGTAARKGKHGGRPPVITDDMPHTVLRRRAGGESVEQIQRDLIIPTGKRKGHTPQWPASTGHSPNTPSARRIPKPSNKPTPTSPRSRPTKSPTPASLSLTERHSDHRELPATARQLREDRAYTAGINDDARPVRCLRPDDAAGRGPRA